MISVLNSTFPTIKSVRVFGLFLFSLFATFQLAGMSLAAEGTDPSSAWDGEPPGVVGQVLFHQKISRSYGGFTGLVDDSDNFGHGVAALGDVDGDGVTDLAVSASGDDDGNVDSGAVWILFLHPNGTIKAHQKISQTMGGFTGQFSSLDGFGSEVEGLGDLDGDGTPDLAVGAPFTDDAFARMGAVWILFLHPNGTVKSHQKISSVEGGFVGPLMAHGHFGSAIANLGDLDRNGVTDIAVGAARDNDGISFEGAVWILFLNSDGTVNGHQKINATEGGFNGVLESDDGFGFSVSVLRIVGSSGSVRLAVGAPGDDDGGPGRGAVWILTIGSDGMVSSHQKISQTTGGFTGALEDSDGFGNSLANLGDLNCDGTADLAVGASHSAIQEGEVWILFLNPNNRVEFHQQIGTATGGFIGELDSGDRFGTEVAPLGDLDGDDDMDLAVGALLDDDGGSNSGAVWNLFLDGNGCFHEPLFGDGFESGDTSAWSAVLP